MAVLRELVFKPADARVSIQCGKCSGETVLSLKGENFPEQCSSCGTRLPKDAGISAQQLRWALRASEKDSVMLRVYEATLEK